ncbi:MAG TPA: DUF6671 family protein [Azospirillaceae bacterium]|nr:DUF6671 family protein [Azospirillaceae bacterium]
MRDGPYRGATVLLATMHGKERAAAPPFRRHLGASVTVPPGLDTDALGTFSGEIPRRGTALETARAKAMLAAGATGLALASEGSFGPHPSVPFLALGTELLLFLDRHRGLELVEALPSLRTNFRHAVLAPDAPADELDRTLAAMRFPSHAVIVLPDNPAAGASFVAKGLRSIDAVAAALRGAADASMNGRARVETDMRAHMNPTRMRVIRAAATRLALRLATPCPACAAPGWGRAGLVPGLPCGWCGTPTSVPRAEALACAACGHRAERPLRNAPAAADPGRCPECNP